MHLKSQTRFGPKSAYTMLDRRNGVEPENSQYMRRIAGVAALDAALILNKLYESVKHDVKNQNATSSE
jgi:hypothetical protein